MKTLNSDDIIVLQNWNKREYNFIQNIKKLE